MKRSISLTKSACILSLVSVPLVNAGEPGKLKREVWTGLSGSSLASLTSSPKFYGTPDITATIDGAQAPSNWGDNYGQRLRGYIVAPESGEYTFWIAGDDNCELFLSTNSSKFNAAGIASVTGWTSPQQWDKFASQQSGKVTLVAGQKYFIEALHKEGGGLDNLALAWQTPSGQREVIPASALESFTVDPEDLDDDGLKDAFETTYGLDANDNGTTNVDNGPLGDPDKDGYLNIEEQQFGTDPKKHGGVPGHFSYERWNTGQGYSILDLKSIKSFNGAPASSEIVAGSEAPANAGEQYGARLTGYITAPATGDYFFWVAGDDNVELSLSINESKFTKEVIAWHKGYTSPRQWDKFPTQKSGSIMLVEGQKYYIEALVKEWGGGDHLSIAWQAPGGQRELLPANVIESMAKDLSDQDGDNLDDIWELAGGLDDTSPAGDDGALGDPDGDFAPNWLEFQAGTDPNTYDASVPGALVYEEWHGIPGRFVRDLKSSSKFLQQPDDRYAVVTGTGPLDNRGDIGNRLRGFITAPATGDYTFWAEGNKEVELWLSTDEDKFNRELLVRTAHFTAPFNYDYDISQKSKTVYLVEGQKYFIECYHKINDKTGNHFTLKWQAPGGVREQIPPTVLSTFNRQANDQDDDDLRDDYELANGLDPNDNGSINPDNGAYGDLDGDGLLNHEEQEYGTAANNADSDGDGVNDYDEIKLLESQALVGDVAPFQNVATLAGASFTNSLGTWVNEGNVAYHSDIRGWVEYTVNLPKAGVYMLDAEIGPRTGGGRSDQYETVFSVNGQNCGRVHNTIAEDSTGHAKVLTPWLPAGNNTVRVFVDNSLKWRKVNIHSLSVLSAQGGDSNSNGTPDWVENRLAANNGLDTGIIQSKVSPVYIEGRARYQGLMTAPSGVQVEAAPGDKWYSRINLYGDGEARVQHFTFENGGLEVSRPVAWAATNLLVENDMTIRQGSSLRLTAFNGNSQEGTLNENVTVAVEGQTYVTTANAPVVHTFNSTGKTIVTATHVQNGVQTTRSITVDVAPYAPALDSPVCVQGYWREWDVPALPAGAVLEIDERIEVREAVVQADGSTRYTIMSSTDEDTRAVVRAANGEIISATTIRGMRLRTGGDTGVYFAEALGDGSYVVEMPAVVDGMDDDLVIRYDIFIGGVTFEDGSVSKDYLATDLDDLGVALVRMIKTGTSGSNCHRASVWQNGMRIAWFY